MGIPFNIALPKFNIDNKSRDITLTFSTFGKMNVPQVTTVIDYWSITDHRGNIINEAPSIDNRYIPMGKHGKKITLVMQGAGFKLAYDCLDVCIHFLTQTGQSYAAHYTYKAIGNTFGFAKIEEAEMTDDEKDTMFDILIKAAEHEKKKPKDKTPSNGNQNQKSGDGFESGYTPEITDYLRAIEREKMFLKGNGGRRYKITNGQFVMQSQGGYIYSFDLDAELYLAEDSPVTVTIGLDSIPGVVLVCENFQVIIALEKIPYADKTLKIPKADISAEPWKLLDKLNNRLRRINETNEIALSLLNDGPRLATAGALSTIARGQENAYNHALNSPITVIWGPPGTGKTYTMAMISAEFLRQGKRVLIVSHSNVSVDNVAKQIYSQTKDSPISALLRESKILRYGYVRDEELQKNEFITSFKAVLKNSPDKKEFDRLQDEYRKLTAEAETSTDTQIQQKILRINQAIKAIKSKHKDTEKKLVANAQLVATTVSKIYADLLFEDMTYDVVMFDEISMAYVPQIVAAASFATEHLICVGDFRQLSPIVQEKNAKAVLGKDLFEFLNISKGFRDINPHPWLIMLDEQRRMHPAISAFPSRFIYNGLLKDHSSVLTKRNAIASTAPFNQPMCLIDLYGTCCFGSKNEDNSRFNILSAVFAFATALKAEKSQISINDCSDEEKVGIITPYAAQTRLIKAMIQDHRQSKRTTKISCATVHQFQGSERNVVIFDAVESCPSTRAGWLMARNEGGSVTRLINVALTRSRGKFIAIANKAFWLNKFESNNMFYSLIKYMSANSHILTCQKDGLANYIKANDFGSNIKVYTSTTTSNVDVLGDIRSAKNKIMLMIPKGRLNAEYAKIILDEVYKQKNNKVSVVIVYDKSVVIPPEYEDVCIPSDKVTMPLLFIDNKAWYGLPIYQHVHTEANVVYPIHTDVIVRFSGKCTVEMIKSLVEHANVKPPVANGLGLYVKNNCHCDCGESLSLVKSNKHFLKCKKCGKTQALTVQMVNRYLDSTGGRCSRCGRDMFAVNGQFGIYVKCSDNHISKLEEI